MGLVVPSRFPITVFVPCSFPVALGSRGSLFPGHVVGVDVAISRRHGLDFTSGVDGGLAVAATGWRPRVLGGCRCWARMWLTATPKVSW